MCVPQENERHALQKNSAGGVGGGCGKEVSGRRCRQCGGQALAVAKSTAGRIDERGDAGQASVVSEGHHFPMNHDDMGVQVVTTLYSTTMCAFLFRLQRSRNKEPMERNC